MINIIHDFDAHEIVIQTPQGQIIINECEQPDLTRIVLQPGRDNFVTNSPC